MLDLSLLPFQSSMNNTKRKKRSKPISFPPPTLSFLPLQMEEESQKCPECWHSGCPDRLGDEGHDTGSIKSGLVRTHFVSAERLKTPFEPGSSPPSCLLFPWHNNELEQVPSGVEDQLSTHGSKNKVTEPGSYSEPPPEVTSSKNKKKTNTIHNSLKIQSKSKVCFLAFPYTVLCRLPSASTFKQHHCWSCLVPTLACI